MPEPARSWKTRRKALILTRSNLPRPPIMRDGGFSEGRGDERFMTGLVIHAGISRKKDFDILAGSVE